MTRVCLDLFAGLGGFSAAFADADEWDVLTVDIAEEFDPDLQADIFDLQPSDLLGPLPIDRSEMDVLVVLAGHPCTLFSLAGNHDQWDFQAQEPVGERARKHVAMVHHTLGLVEALAPDYWFLENPRGRLRWVLGPPTGTVTYCQYGEPYQKPTDLWGDHPPGLSYRSCPKGADCHGRNTEWDGTGATSPHGDSAAERAKVPYELSREIRDAVEQAVETGDRQTTLLEGSA